MNATFKGNNSIELSWKPSTNGVESYKIVYTDMWEVKHVEETKDVSGETIHFTGRFLIIYAEPKIREHLYFSKNWCCFSGGQIQDSGKEAHIYKVCGFALLILSHCS